MPNPPAKPVTNYNNFIALDLRVGTIDSCEPLKSARKPAYVLVIDFGEPLGKLQSSAQITDLYSVDELLGRQVIAVVNFPAKRIASVSSECLVLGVPNSKSEVVLLQPDRRVTEGVSVF